MDLGKSLRVALAMKNMQQKTLAKELDINQRQISNWVASGKFSRESLANICKALDMPVSEFIALGEG
jgi:transcriptional regulator with XRE-family HTH domain